MCCAGLDPERLYVSYFGGEPKYDLPSDDETRDLWKKVRQQRLNRRDSLRAAMTVCQR